MMIRSLMYYKNVYIMVWKGNNNVSLFACKLMDLIFGDAAAAAAAVVVCIEWKKRRTRHMNWQIIMSFWAWLLDLLVHGGHWFSFLKNDSHRIDIFFRSIWKSTFVDKWQHISITNSMAKLRFLKKKTRNALINKKKQKIEACNLHTKQSKEKKHWKKFLILKRKNASFLLIIFHNHIV